MVVPCQVPQRRMALFDAQPFGPGLFLRDAVLLAVRLGPPNFTARALPRAKTGAGAAVNETSTDPRVILSRMAPWRSRPSLGCGVFREPSV
ncbi:hypothetical protein CXK94_22005 [Stutzerimonas stutzeri]|uniref:Uncharacterized protein n=1 Tax=Stutzerimonas stutzeri TaxID=316 RepID=A0A2N8SPU2_STUST|nr:hypothetical protein CXK94_22005 [Stutzerimonas stutzeri]